MTLFEDKRCTVFNDFTLNNATSTLSTVAYGRTNEPSTILCCSI